MIFIWEPVTIELGSSIEPVRTGVKRKLFECKDTFQYVLSGADTGFIVWWG